MWLWFTHYWEMRVIVFEWVLQREWQLCNISMNSGIIANKKIHFQVRHGFLLNTCWFDILTYGRIWFRYMKGIAMNRTVMICYCWKKIGTKTMIIIFSIRIVTVRMKNESAQDFRWNQGIIVLTMQQKCTLLILTIFLVNIFMILFQNFHF